MEKNARWPKCKKPSIDLLKQREDNIKAMENNVYFLGQDARFFKLGEPLEWIDISSPTPSTKA